MTIATQASKVQYAGSGATVYPYAFKVFAATDLVVIRLTALGVQTTLALTTDYTVSGVGADTGGSVTLVGAQAAAPPSTGEKLLIKRLVPLTQSTDWVENDDFPAQVIEDAVDRVICIAQQLQEQVDRSLKVADTSTLATVIDPTSISADATASAANAAAAVASAAQAAANAASIRPGTPNGVATLDATGNVPAAQLANAQSAGSNLYLFNTYTALGGF